MTYSYWAQCPRRSKQSVYVSSLAVCAICINNDLAVVGKYLQHICDHDEISQTTYHTTIMQDSESESDFGTAVSELEYVFLSFESDAAFASAIFASVATV